MSEHYFTASPASADERREIRVELAGREHTLETAPGVFSPGHLDGGTAVLLKHVEPAHGHVLDVGCGWGPIALAAALAAEDAYVTAVDVNERALDLLRRNAARVGVGPRIHAVTPDEVAPDARFDAIWSNPPIRIGKPALHALLERWLPTLVPGGRACLVVQKNLGADSLTRWIADQGWGDVERIASSQGFRVLQLTRT